jgi:two-component system chemotaxis sensor kinase CheA
MELNQDMLNELSAESAELVERFARVWLKLSSAIEQGSAVSRETIDDLFRTLHSLKSLSELASRHRTVSALHLMEDRLTQVREGLSSLNSTDLDLLAQSQLILEKIFGDKLLADDDVCIGELEYLAQQFCLGSDQTEEKGPPVSRTQPNDQPRAYSGPQSDAQQKAQLTQEEILLIEKFRQRDESFFAFAGQGDSDVVGSKIVPIGDVLVHRIEADYFLLVFATELDQPLVEAIVEGPLRLLRKNSQDVEAVIRSWLPAAPSTVPDSPEIFSLSVSPETAQKTEDSPPDFLAEAEKWKNEAFNAAESAGKQSDSAGAFSAPESLQTDAADPEMVADFLSNANELLESLTQSLLVLESNPTDSATIEEIFRAAHTIKGTAGMLGFSTIEKLCHALENTFDRMRKGQLHATPSMVDRLLNGWDKVRELFGMLERGQKPEIPIDEFLRRLQNADQKGAPEVAQVISVPQAQAEAASAAPNHKNDSQGTIRIDLKRLDSLVNLVGELVIDRTRFAGIEEAMRNGGTVSDLSHQMAESVLLFGRHMNEVQNIIMQVRMVPVGNVFLKFSRMVRDLSRQTGKEVELILEGGETELDKTLVEELADPLIHLLRNSIDHGIEAPEVREARGKPRKGQIRLKAAQQGNMIVITVSDDGNGLNAEKIRSKAIRNGLIKDTDSFLKNDLFNLIFEPGFSTAETVTNISGRGVGMDVVKKNIQKLKGIIELNSEEGQGTSVVVKLPITLAIVPSLVVQVKGENFAIPIVNVIESIRVEPSEIQQMGTSRFFKVRDQVVPIVHLGDVLELKEVDEKSGYRQPRVVPAMRSRRRERMVFVVIGIGPERLGLIVDRLVGQQEIVIRSLGRLLKDQSSLAGGCIMGDGRVALVLDIVNIFGHDHLQRGVHARRAS